MSPITNLAKSLKLLKLEIRVIDRASNIGLNAQGCKILVVILGYFHGYDSLLLFGSFAYVVIWHLMLFYSSGMEKPDTTLLYFSQCFSLLAFSYLGSMPEHNLFVCCRLGDSKCNVKLETRRLKNVKKL